MDTYYLYKKITVDIIILPQHFVTKKVLGSINCVLYFFTKKTS